jgi:hypothetical protein
MFLTQNTPQNRKVTMKANMTWRRERIKQLHCCYKFVISLFISISQCPRTAFRHLCHLNTLQNYNSYDNLKCSIVKNLRPVAGEQMIETFSTQNKAKQNMAANIHTSDKAKYR